MSTCTDVFSFNNYKMFDLLRKCLPDNKNVSQNLVVCKDDVLFAWNSKDCCLLAINWKAKTEDDSVDYQVCGFYLLS